MARQPENHADEVSVFLNVPYDEDFRSLYLAYIAGLTHLGLVPHVTLGYPDGTRRLEKILREIKSCRYSIHDLSRVTVDKKKGFHTPRFNMPFELGLAVAWQTLNPGQHTWFLFEEKDYRIQKSLSDLNGTDPQIHQGKVSGVMRQLSNVFKRPEGQPTVPDMLKTYQALSRKSSKILTNAATTDLFEARVFEDLCIEAKLEVESRNPKSQLFKDRPITQKHKP